MKKIKDGYKETEIGVLPEGWEVKKLKEIGIFRKGKGIQKYEVQTEGLQCIRYGEIYTTYEHIVRRTKSFINQKSAVNSMPIENGDLIFAVSGETIEDIGKAVVYINKEKCFVGGDTIIMKPYENIDGLFLSYYLATNGVTKQKRKLGQGTSIVHIYIEGIKSIKTLIPPLSEQQCIAEILSATDAHIEKLDAIIADIQLLKKGMMQKLLTQGIGHTEFKDTEIGKIPKAWEVKCLVEISKNKGEYGIGSKAVEYIKDKPRYLRITDFDEFGRLIDADQKSISEENYERYILQKGDLVFARTGNTTGKSYLYREKDGELVFAGFLIKFTIDTSKAKSEFIKYCCQTKIYWDWVKMSSTRSGQPGLNSNQYGDLKLPLPPLSEQHHIAEILSAIDDRIQLYEKEKADFIELKKGLMEQLLTGKIRVKE